MKKNIIAFAVAAVCVVSMAATTPIATRDWVKDYVGKFAPSAANGGVTATTNANGSVSTSVPVGAGDSMANVISNETVVSVSFVTVPATNLILRAVASTVSTVPVGTAWRAYGDELWSTNRTIPLIDAKLYGRQVVTTNVFGEVSTSRVTKRVLVATGTDGVGYRGELTDGAWWLCATNDATRCIQLLPIRVGDAEANRVYRGATAFSAWTPSPGDRIVLFVRGLLFGTAHAATTSSATVPFHKWEEVNATEYEAGDFATEADALQIQEIVEVVLTKANGQEVHIPIGELEGNAGAFDSALLNSLKTPVDVNVFTDLGNWNIPGETDDRGRDWIILGDERFPREDFEGSEAWKDFAASVYEWYLGRFLALTEKHECTIGADCCCANWTSVHCPLGMQKATTVNEAQVPNEAYKERRHTEAYYSALEGGVGCVKCDRCGHVEEHRQKQYSCRCHCGEVVVRHVPRADGCGCLCPDVPNPMLVSADLDFHPPAVTNCGCRCGAMRPVDNENYHLHPLKEGESTGGATKCTCVCGKRHVFEENLSECPRVCGDCRKKTESGGDARLEDHDPMTTAEARRKNRCGCQCGEYTVGDAAKDANINNIAKFHYRKANSCMCLGADGQGGAWHFPNKANGGCNVCVSPSHGDDTTPMRVAKPFSGDACEKGLYEATGSSHVNSSDYCGCKCGHYSPSNENVPNSMHKQNANSCGCACGQDESVTHRYATAADCTCTCGEMHRGTRMNECGICMGCNKAFMDPNGPKRYGKSPTVDDHEADTVSCGCKCGAYTYSNRTDEAKRFHTRTSDATCTCHCGWRHWFNPRSDCTAFCETCNMDKERVNYRHGNIGKHTQPSDSCACLCGKWKKGEVDGHKYDPERCHCHCGNDQRTHDWDNGTTTSRSLGTCPSCENAITEHKKTYTCERLLCRRTRDGGTWEEGHDGECSKVELEGTQEVPPVGDPCACGCYGHASGNGICETCGNKCGDVNGGDSGGTGGGGVNGGTNNNPDNIK